MDKRIYIAIGVMLILISEFTQGHSLGFSIYSNETLLKTYKGLYANASSNDVLIDDIYQNPYLTYYNKPQIFPRMILANNYSWLQSETIVEANKYSFNKSDYLGYDVEDWDLTPLSEQQNIVSYTTLACNYIHQAGYKVAFTPEIDVPNWYGITDFKAIDWSCIDFLDLQEQFLTNNPTLLVKNVTDLSAIAKADNTNLIIFVQLDMQAGSKSLLEADISNLSKINGINGVIIQDLSNSASSNQTLIDLVDYTESFGNYTTSTSSTSTLTTSSLPSTTTLLSTSSLLTSSLSSSSSIFTVTTSYLPSSYNTSTSISSITSTINNVGFIYPRCPVAWCNQSYAGRFYFWSNIIRVI